MSPMFVALLVSVSLAAVIAVAWIHALDRADAENGTRIPLPTARQRRQWKRERLKFNPKLSRRSSW